MIQGSTVNLLDDVVVVDPQDWYIQVTGTDNLRLRSLRSVAPCGIVSKAFRLQNGARLTRHHTQ